MENRQDVTVLVVDDEPLVRMDLVALLEAAGFQTREASCAAEAIGVLEQDRGIRVLFTDIQMPGSMDGLALSHYVSERWPPTILVICSGNRAPPQDKLPQDASFIAKPVSRIELDSLLRAVEFRLFP